VYLAGVVVVIAAMRCGFTPARMERLKELVGVSAQTVLRWQKWWRHVLPDTAFWRSACGALTSPVVTSELPLSLLEQFVGTVEERSLALLRFLAPLTGGSKGAKVM
jgi:hypothetical protein